MNKTKKNSEFSNTPLITCNQIEKECCLYHNVTNNYIEPVKAGHI